MSAVADPHDFVRQLRAAYSIERFEITFGLPNPWDVNADFQAPLQRFLREAEGKKGKAAIAGKSLAPDVLEDLARSAAATGEEAQASLRTAPGKRPVRKRLRQNPATVETDGLDDSSGRQEAARDVRSAYAAVRRPDGEGEER